MKQAKTYIVFVNDHSGSMESIKNAARVDYNQNIEAIKEGATHEKLDTIVSVIGIGSQGAGTVERQVVISNPHVLNPKQAWPCPGNTPLYDALDDAMTLMCGLPDISEPHVSVLVMTTTDGEEYGSRRVTIHDVKSRINSLQNTGRWTFVFRVPKGGRAQVREFGVPEGNIQEWETTAAGMAATTAVSQTAMRGFMSQQVSGKRSSGSFYSDATNVNLAQLQEVPPGKISLYVVPPEFNGKWIRDFILTKRTKYLKGSAFYQLTKTEARVQPDKHVLIRDQATGKFFSGDAARDMIGLPKHQNARLNPGDHGKYDIFIQSNSVNRHLVADTGVAYWAEIGTEFTEEEMTRYDPKPVVTAPPPPAVVQLPKVVPTNKPTKSPLVPQKKEPVRIFYATRDLARQWSKKSGRPVMDAGKDQPKDKRWYSDPEVKA